MRIFLKYGIGLASFAGSALFHYIYVAKVEGFIYFS